MDVRRLCSHMAVVAAMGVLAGALSGCSGTGASAVPGETAELEEVATDHLTSLLLVKRWFSILHVRSQTATAALWASSCPPSYEPLPPEPGDPPGTRRWTSVTSDCMEYIGVDHPDGSGEWTAFDPMGHVKKTMTWSPLRVEGSWCRQDLVLTLPDDGVRLDCESGANMASTEDEQYLKGQATLGGVRSMAFDVERTMHLDRVALELDDGAELSVQVPVHAVPGSVAWPVFTEGAAGSYQAPGASRLTFRLWSTGPDRWEKWEFRAADGTSGDFTLGDGLAGTGTMRSRRAVLGVLQWGDSADGLLEPVQAAAAAVLPSAAARDFAIDQWIGNIAAMGPRPQY